MAAQFTAKTANSEKAIYLSLMSCSSLTLHAPLSLQPSIYIYIERERERGRESIYIFFIYMVIFTEKWTLRVKMKIL